jgi:hypothetical protein
MMPVPLKGVAWVEAWYDEDDRTDAETGVFTTLVTPLAFFMSLFFKHDIIHRIRPGPLIFLDKVCINQNDKELKQKGISKLGAFIGKSSSMLILYTDVYLRRLWTVYEMACYLVTHNSTKGMEIQHMYTAPLFFGCVIGLWLIAIISWMPYWSGALSAPTLVYMLYGLVYAIWSRSFHRSLASTRHIISTFRIKDAECWDEADRPFVLGNIVAFMKLKNYVSVGASREDALDAFDGLVQRTFSYVLQTSFPAPLPFKYMLVALFLTDFCSALDCISALIRKYGIANINVLAAFMSYTSAVVSFNPCGAAAVVWMTSKFLSLSDWREWIWITSSTIVAFAVIAPLAKFGDLFLYPRAKTSHVYLVAFIMFHATIWAITAFIRLRQGWQNEAVDVALAQEMKTYREVCSDKSTESHRLSMRRRFLQLPETPEASSLECSSMGAKSSLECSSFGANSYTQSPSIPEDRVNFAVATSQSSTVAVASSESTEGNQQAPTRLLNQPFPQTMGQS